ncbi:MAG: 4-(cytidine 5'-diphospho)-2-C-methyl-D-erythritol kinase [Kiloniellales bacterium]|nr:4-(cytidine 5'-diphospho)-2-C-methyl-D-erythritol kinase [Kiloniellales bacterium]
MAGGTLGARAPELRLRARAKVNLYLHVTGKRLDGYHELDSLMVFPDLGDELSLGRAAELSLEVEGPFAAALGAEGPDNLVLRAARALGTLVGGGRGARLRLTKNLPVAAGIGGGSADAAATLRGLIRLWNQEVSEAKLRALALELGADVPPCLESRPVFARGIGEDLTPAPPLPPFWVVLVNPGVPLSTAKVFNTRRGAFSEAAAVWGDPPRDLDDVLDVLYWSCNDLERPAIALAPKVGDVLAALQSLETCRLARLSGSGATCFGIFAEADQAAEAAAALSSAHADWWVAAAPVAD